jgi:hypothetical protein
MQSYITLMPCALILSVVKWAVGGQLTEIYRDKNKVNVSRLLSPTNVPFY